MDEIMVMFLRDVLGVKAPDFGEEFSEERARVAWELVNGTVRGSRELREATPNRFGFFPRASLRDHADIELLRPLVEERTRELKDALLSGAGAYALGSETLTYSELLEVQEEYLATARLSLALDAEHERWHAEQSEIREAAQRASNAFPDGTTPEQANEALEVRLVGEPAPLTGEQVQSMAYKHCYYSDVLDGIAKRSPSVMGPLVDGKKIQAIKELRILTRCGLLDAKQSVERVMEQQEV